MDSALLLNRDRNGKRWLSSRQRVGVDLCSTLIELSTETGNPIAIGSREQGQVEAVKRRIMSFLAENPGAVEREVDRYRGQRRQGNEGNSP